MRYIQYVLIGSIIAFLSATDAHATATYKWHSTSPGPYVTATGGELVVTNAAYFSGSIDFHVHDPETSSWIQYGGVFPDLRIVNSPVILAGLMFQLNNGEDDYDLAPWVYTFPASSYFVEADFPFTGVLTFNDDGTLTGDLFLYAETSEANASGTHYDWSVFNYGADYFDSDLCGPPTCSGGAGYWQLSSVSVPEPPVWSLFALGIVGLFGFRRQARLRSRRTLKVPPPAA